MSIAGIHLQAQPAKATALTRNQVRGFWGGWTLDEMDSHFYSPVVVPSLARVAAAFRHGRNKRQHPLGRNALGSFLFGWGWRFCGAPSVVNLGAFGH